MSLLLDYYLSLPRLACNWIGEKVAPVAMTDYCKGHQIHKYAHAIILPLARKHTNRKHQIHKYDYAQPCMYVYEKR